MDNNQSAHKLFNSIGISFPALADAMDEEERRLKIDNIMQVVLRKVKNNLDILFDFDNQSDKEFKKTYGYTKNEIKSAVEERI